MENLDIFLELGVRFIKGSSCLCGFHINMYKNTEERESIWFLWYNSHCRGANLSFFFPGLFYTAMLGWLILSSFSLEIFYLEIFPESASPHSLGLLPLIYAHIVYFTSSIKGLIPLLHLFSLLACISSYTLTTIRVRMITL